MRASSQLRGHCSHWVNHGGGLGWGEEKERPELNYIWRGNAPGEGPTSRASGGLRWRLAARFWLRLRRCGLNLPAGSQAQMGPAAGPT